jgi:hypothetical protein
MSGNVCNICNITLKLEDHCIVEYKSLCIEGEPSEVAD